VPSGPLWGALSGRGLFAASRPKVLAFLWRSAQAWAAFAGRAGRVAPLWRARCGSRLMSSANGGRHVTRFVLTGAYSLSAYKQSARRARLTTARVRMSRRRPEGGGVHRLAAAVILCSGAEGREAVADGARAGGDNWSRGKPHSWNSYLLG
jgi:hypothetical protein